MKKVNVIVRALVACIALGNLPIDAMRGRNKTPRPVPAPSQKPATTNTGAEAAAKRLLAQDTSKMDFYAFEAWTNQVVENLGKMGLNRPATLTLRKELTRKIKTYADQKAAESVPPLQPIVIGQGQGGEEARFETDNTMPPLELAPEEEQLAEGTLGDITFPDKGTSTVQVDVKGTDPKLKPIKVDVRSKEVERLTNVIAQLGSQGDAGLLAKLKTDLAQKEAVQNALINNFKTITDAWNTMSVGLVSAMMTSQKNWQQNTTSLPDNLVIPFAQNELNTLRHPAEALFKLVAAGAFSNTLALQAKNVAKEMLANAYQGALLPITQSVTQVSLALQPINTLVQEQVNEDGGPDKLVDDLQKSITNNGKMPSLYYTVLFLRMRLDPTLHSDTQSKQHVTELVNALQEIPKLLKKYPNDSQQLNSMYESTLRLVKGFMDMAKTYSQKVSTVLARKAADALRGSATESDYWTSNKQLADVVKAATNPQSKEPNFSSLVANFAQISAILKTIFPDADADELPDAQVFYSILETLDNAYDNANRVK